MNRLKMNVLKKMNSKKSGIVIDVLSKYNKKIMVFFIELYIMILQMSHKLN